MFHERDHALLKYILELPSRPLKLCVALTHLYMRQNSNYKELQIPYRRPIKMKKDFALEASATDEGHLCVQILKKFVGQLECPKKVLMLVNIQTLDPIGVS